jgi:hypothetical protein
LLSLAPLIVSAKPGAKSPETVETLTPTFSNTRPFMTPRTPPPPCSSPSVSRSQAMYSNFASEPASRSIASKAAQMPSRSDSNHARACSVWADQSLIARPLPKRIPYGKGSAWFPFRSPVKSLP